MPLFPSLRDVNQKLVAVGTLAVVGAGCVFAFAVGQLHLFDQGYTMSGVFADTAGIKAGQDVRVAGVKAGRVTGVRPSFKTGTVIITWHVNKGIDLGPDTRAAIETTTLLGGRYLRLSGPVAHPYMASVPESRRRIPLERTQVPFTVPDALQGAQNIIGKLDEKSIDKLLAEMSKIHSPNAAKLNEMLRNVQSLSRALNDSYPEVEKLIEGSKTITSTLAAKEGQLKEIIDNSRILLRVLVERRDQLAATIGQGSRTVRTLSNTISRNQKQLDTLLDNLHLLTTRLAPNMDVLNTDFSLLGPTFEGVAGVQGNGKWIEGVLSGLGPLQPDGPISTRINPPGGKPADRTGAQGGGN
ncbi:MCE family protein [Actinomadura rupiterrae]|uniref:MCE family protein n=1 Tax=Actinomadura rupiterrae TaxID=559627 RepID=UPI0020A5F58B|nr:MlaD family protein [Actinomadura rupiterrae]MCP2334777.1 phospholipid/cholesterol/gamma-HCH transport system substrate-binding protein [Actinomadura rupiterrae]